MSKPFKINFLNGTVFLNNIDKDNVENVRQALVRLEQSVDKETLPEAKPIEQDVSHLTETALGVHRESNGQYTLSVLKYNPGTGEAQVVERSNAGDHKSIALGKFKEKAVDLKIV